MHEYLPSGSLMVSDVNTDSEGAVVSFDVLLLRSLLSARQLLNIYINPYCANHNISRLLFSSADMFK